ncbi:hypothetical protein [Paraburkholderia flagellata]|uniref:hypothetical protein n=1 Tax=Paraburkholderia flagellata TaxID=2883241 RepID=UPI001F187658|nr:hypothetical protein [Paraburkholderia flagellata]
MAALDPLTTYGMRQVPDRIDGAAPGANTFENAPIWETLEHLAKRELTGNAARDEVQRLMTFLTPQSAELFKRISRGTQTHGEIVVLVDGVIASREIGNGIINRVSAGGAFEENEQPVFQAWDQIPLSAVVPKGKYEVGYR